MLLPSLLLSLSLLALSLLEILISMKPRLGQHVTTSLINIFLMQNLKCMTALFDYFNQGVWCDTLFHDGGINLEYAIIHFHGVRFSSTGIDIEDE